MLADELAYVGFWARVGASLIDTVLFGIIISPLMTAFYGFAYWEGEGMVRGSVEYWIFCVVLMAAVIAFWVKKQATPGKMALSAKIVDARTSAAPSIGQFIIRYLAYFLSALPLCLGIFWIAFDGRKQGWHDKLAGTVVVRQKSRKPQPATFNTSR